MKKMDKCCLCGAADKKMTRDHIPPEGFFPIPLPKNLITVPCCEECHKPLSLEDEAFRIWASSVHGASPAGKWILQNKVFGSSFKRSPKLYENVKKFIGIQKLNSLGQTLNVPTISIPTERANRFLIRLTKGLLAHFYPDYDYSLDQFIVRVPLPTREHLIKVQEITKISF